MLLYPASFAHGSFAFGAHLNADGTPNIVNAQNTVVIDEREIDTAFRDLRDPYHLTRGGALGRIHKGFGLVRLSGRILVPNASQDASRSDKERELLAAFDPELCYLDSPTTDGAYAFDFSEPTTDTATYGTGRIPLRYYARPAARPRLIARVDDSAASRWAMALVCPDPRAFEQTEQTLVLTPAGASGNVVNRGNVRAPLKATIVMAGAGHASFTITRAGVSFILDLSGMVNLDTVVVVFETCGPYGEGRKITKNGTRTFSIKTSAPSTWLDVPVGTTSFSISNTTNVTSVTLAWHSARA